MTDIRRFADFHTHSCFSDGACRPEELIALADCENLAAVALTDHDTTDALARARAAAKHYRDLKFVPGIEVSAKFPTGMLHIIGLFIDEFSPALVELLARLRLARSERNPKMIAKLQAMGLAIDLQEVREMASRHDDRDEHRIVGRLHMADVLCNKGHVSSIREAFKRYLGNAAPAFVDKERLTAREVIATIKAAGGLPVLAHPAQMKCRNTAQLERALRDFIHAGLDGIEVYHSDHTPRQMRLYLDLARRYDLSVSGGSDFHGPAKPDVQLGRPRVPLAAINGKIAQRLEEI